MEIYSKTCFNINDASISALFRFLIAQATAANAWIFHYDAKNSPRDYKPTIQHHQRYTSVSKY